MLHCANSFKAKKGQREAGVKWMEGLCLGVLLYQQLGSYRNAEAAVTAGILLLLCGIIFALLEQQKDE